MNAAASATNVAVIGGGISGAVCASLLAARGVAVTLFDSGRGAGGRMAQRREVMEDGTDLRFDHGAPYFTVSNDEVTRLVRGCEARRLVAERGHVRVLRLRPANSRTSRSLDGRDLGNFDYVVATNKNIASPRFSGLTGRPPPLDLSLLPQLSMMIKDIPVCPWFALMLAFTEPLTKVPVEGFSFDNSDYLSWAFCDGSKPGHARVPLNSQSWVLHSTAEYASKVINNIGQRKPPGSS
ncbi:hypothetical protein ABZP36_006239 [Zizania latifolia]